MNLIPIGPLVECAPYGGVGRRKQRGRSVQGFWKTAAQSARHACLGHPTYLGSAQIVIVDTEVEGRAHRCVGQHEVAVVDREVGDQPIECSLLAGETYRASELERRFEQSLHDLLRNYIVYPDGEAQGAMCRPLLESAQEIAPEAEDFVRVTVDEPSCLGRGQGAARFDQQFLPQARFEGLQLGADGGSR